MVSKKTTRTGFGMSVNSFLNNINGVKSVQDKSIDTSKYKVGMSVKHKKFGLGVITKLEPEGDDIKIEINFEKFGFKRLMANFTPLEIIE